MSAKYDLILFGVTGFTGRLAAEYLLEHKYDIRWAVCARNPTKAQAVLTELGTDAITVLQAESVCETDEQWETLRKIVQSTKVVATCVGPFEKYGHALIQLCAECGVHYTDITGETDFVRQSIAAWDKVARENQATIISHCGNDCIPHDLIVYELHQKAKEMGMQLAKVETFCDFPPSASVSGGTATTANFQINKKRTKSGTTSFDPLLTTANGTKAACSLENISPKGTIHSSTLDASVSPWIMGPVMVNCIRRSNALLEYAPKLQMGDSKLNSSTTWTDWAQELYTKATLAAGIALGMTFLLPKPGEGPTREAMEAGYFILTAVAELRNESDDANEGTKKLKAVFHFRKDTGYLYTAALLVETCMTILETKDMPYGVLTPAAALGHDLTERVLKTMEASLSIEQL